MKAVPLEQKIAAWKELAPTEQLHDVVGKTMLTRKEWERLEAALTHPVTAPEKGREGWIPVGERLPPIGERVILLDGEDVAFGIFTGAKRPDNQWEAENYGYDGCSDRALGVTHWMPLPTAPHSQEAGER